MNWSAAQDTIFALSSGPGRAALAIIRVSGPQAHAAAATLAGTVPAPRQARLRTLRDAAGGVLDRTIVVFFAGPSSATGEDVVEFHLHGGTAIVRAVLDRLAALPDLRPAEAGEFTRRSLLNGRIDLSQAEGLADLLAAETETARRAAQATADGAVSRLVAAWQERLLALSAQAEALIDHADEDDVIASGGDVAALHTAVTAAADELALIALAPSAERLRDGITVVIAGPPNAGKSSLMNALAGRDVAIATPIPGTTRDRLEVTIEHGGVTWVLVDVAGLRADATDPIEAIGIDRANHAIANADICLWLGDEPAPAAGMVALHPRADESGRGAAVNERLSISSATGAGLTELWQLLHERANRLLPRSDQVALNRRQLERFAQAARDLRDPPLDLLIIAEQLRSARRRVLAILGTTDVEDLLDAIFSRYCVGK